MFKLNDHNDLGTFLKIADKLLDNIAYITYNLKCKIRVEWEILRNAESIRKDPSASTESKAFSSQTWQDGPETPSSWLEEDEGPSETDEEFYLSEFEHASRR